MMWVRRVLTALGVVGPLAAMTVLAPTTSAAPLKTGDAGPTAGPAQQVRYGELSSVAAMSPDDVWAVGSVVLHPFHDADATIRHWNGSRWTDVADHAPGASTS